MMRIIKIGIGAAVLAQNTGDEGKLLSQLEVRGSCSDKPESVCREKDKLVGVTDGILNDKGSEYMWTHGMEPCAPWLPQEEGFWSTFAHQVRHVTLPQPGSLSGFGTDDLQSLETMRASSLADASEVLSQDRDKFNNSEWNFLSGLGYYICQKIPTSCGKVDLVNRFSALVADKLSELSPAIQQFPGDPKLNAAVALLKNYVYQMGGDNETLLKTYPLHETLGHIRVAIKGASTDSERGEYYMIAAELVKEVKVVASQTEYSTTYESNHAAVGFLERGAQLLDHPLPNYPTNPFKQQEQEVRNVINQAKTDEDWEKAFQLSDQLLTGYRSFRCPISLHEDMSLSVFRYYGKTAMQTKRYQAFIDFYECDIFNHPEFKHDEQFKADYEEAQSQLN